MDDISGPVREFIATHIDSIDTLRVLLLLRRNADRDWTVEAVCSALRIPPVSTQTQVTLLTSRGFLLETAGTSLAYRYRSPSLALDALVMELDELDRERPVTLINQIYSAKRSSAQSFADAFRLKRDH